MSPRIDLDDGRIVPGGTLRGLASWDRSAPPEAAELRLCWTLQGPDLPDVTEVVCSVDVATLPSAATGGPYRRAIAAEPGGPLQERDGRRFEIPLPESPYSFAGRLAQLSWLLELSLRPGDERTVVTLTLSPSGRPIQLANDSG